MKRSRFEGLLGALLTCAACGCGGAPQAPAVVPTQPPAVGAPSSASASAGAGTAAPRPDANPIDAFALPEGPREDDPVAPEPGPLALDAWQRASKVKGIAPAPASCAAYARRAPAQPAPKDLPSALAEPDAAKRDALLAALEGKDVSARALRAELAPTACADAIADRWLASQKGGVSGRMGHALVGLSLAGKLARTASSPPKMGATRDKAKVLEFIKGPLKSWVVEQASAIEALSAGATGLSGYGRGVAAVEAGSADLRLVDKIRSAPTPAGWDAELKQVYEAALDEALEPRKARGRDAALVGLGDLTRLGSLHDARVDEARSMLAKLYGGRRVDALDGLLLPKWELPAPSSPTDRALAVTPVFFSDRAPWAPTDVAALAPALARGVPEAMRAAFRGGQGPKELRSSYARARLEMGRLAWRRVDFVEAAYAAKGDPDRLVLAVALALAHGPTSAAAMMRAPFVLEHTEALDALAAEGNGMAAFDAAHLRSIGVPATAPAAWLRDVAARFRKAESLLTDPAQKKLAAERAAEADGAAAAAGGKP
jgi:hypothetical protein